jgi:hypothetical protein
MELKFRPIRADEVDVRIARVLRNGAGLQLLFYKDARVDQNILDETVGAMNWQRHHTRDNANCIVSIWDEDKKQWVSKEDTGTESNTEAQKGLASDSFKRACFNWGIGRELYTAPNVLLFNSDGAELFKTNGGKCYDYFAVKELQVKNGCIVHVVVSNESLNSKVVYVWDKAGRPQKPEEQEEQQPEEPQKDSAVAEVDVRLDVMKDWNSRTKGERQAIMKYYGISDIANITVEQGKRYLEDAEKRRKQKCTQQAT